MRLILAILAVGLLLAAPLTAQERRTLTVTGEGRVTAVPDMAMVRIGVTTEAGTAAEALARNSADMAAVMARLAEEGVGERDLQTSTLNLGPRHEHREDGTAVVVGYTARNVLTVRVTDLDSLGGILDAAATDGANTFEGLSFDVVDPQPLTDEALRLAVVDARRKAGLLAAEAGITLGEVLRLDEGGGQMPRPMDMAMSRMAAAEAVPVASGELQLSATVHMVFEIAE